MPTDTDPVLRNARREAVIIGLFWLSATAFCCSYCYFYGYPGGAGPLGPADIRPVFGMPSWFFWGVIVPWAACSAFTLWFAGFYMTDDDLGKDHAGDLEAEVREGGLHE